MNSRVLSWGVLVVASAASLGLAATARGDARADAVAIVEALAHDPAHAAVTSGSVKEAKDALDRAARMRAAGDETHARLADGVALEWAETARDLVRAVDAEERATTLRLDALDASARGDRERALVEEGIARTGRFRAQLEDLQADAKHRPARTSPSAVTLDAGKDPAPTRTRPSPAVTLDGGAP